MDQSGGGNESFSYPKNYSIGPLRRGGVGTWQVQSGSGGGASGSGWTFASYPSGSATSHSWGGYFSPSFTQDPEYYFGTPLTISADILSDTPTLVSVQPRAFTTTSYSFQTYADFNGIDWSETGEKVSSGTAGTMNAFSYGASGLGFAAPSLTGDVAGITPTIANGSVAVNGASFTYSGTTQYAYLDDNGVWQAASSPSSNTAYFGVGQTTNWSVSGSGALSPSNAEAYGNGISGTANVSGSGTDMYDYRQYYSYSSADGGEWTPTGSGDGYADGSGSVTFSYSGGGAYSTIDSNWEWSPSDTDSPAGTAQTAAWLGQTQNGSWSGSVLASGDATQSYGYSTDSTYTSADGWTSTGTTSASVGGSMSASFLAGSPFAFLDRRQL